MSRPPSEVSLVRSAAAHTMHARHDGLEITAKARQSFKDSFPKRVREEAAARGESLTEAEIRRRADHLCKAHFKSMAARSAAARRKAASG